MMMIMESCLIVTTEIESIIKIREDINAEDHGLGIYSAEMTTR